MPKRPTNLETLQLALELLKRIPRQRKVTAAELLEQLRAAGIERDVKTIHRQLDMLCSAHGVERDDRNKPYGYRMKENQAGFTVPALSDAEALMLMLAEQHLKPLLPASVMKSMAGLFAQARRRIGSQARPGRENEWLGKVRVVSPSQPLLPAPIKDGILEAVSQALFNNRWLQVDYRNAAGKRTRHDVMPLGLAQQASTLYLVCRFEGYQDDRILALHRMLGAGATPKAFFRPRDFDLATYDADGRFGLGDGRRIRIEFEIGRGAGGHLLETPLSRDQRVEETGRGYRISATMIDSEWLWRWVRGFGREIGGVRVDGVAVDPMKPGLRARRRPVAQRSTKVVDGGGPG